MKADCVTGASTPRRHVHRKEKPLSLKETSEEEHDFMKKLRKGRRIIIPRSAIKEEVKLMRARVKETS